MKTASAALLSYISAARSQIDSPLAFADCFTFTLSTGTTLAYTNVDFPIRYNGLTFSATGPLVQGLRYKSSVGLEVDKQQISIAARTADLVAGSPFLAAIRDGAFDGARVQRDRVFLSAPNGVVVAGVMLFHGRVSTVDSVGRTCAVITVASDLIVLDYDMPRNLFSPTCLHTLYDSGCGVVRDAYSTSGVVTAASTASAISFTGAAAAHTQGSIVFSSGMNANVRATIKTVVVGATLTLVYPLPNAPTAGDAFTISSGCDHTAGTCQARFDNLPKFRGFPYVPPAQIAY